MSLDKRWSAQTHVVSIPQTPRELTIVISKTVSNFSSFYKPDSK